MSSDEHNAVYQLKTMAQSDLLINCSDTINMIYHCSKVLISKS